MATSDRLPGYLRLDEAAKIIGVSHSQVWRYVNDGLLDAINIGGTYLLRECDVRIFTRPPRGNPAFRGEIQSRKKRR